MTRRRFRVIIGSLFVILALVVSQIPTGQASADQAKTSDFDMDGTTLIRYTGTAKTVSVPDSVKVISPEAFKDNSTMTSLTIPSSVKEIGMYAFSGCSLLSEVKIGDGIEKIGNAAFSNCSSLKSVTIGKNLTSLGTGVFLDDTKLSEVSFSTDSDYICSDGVIYSKDKTVLAEVLSGRKAKSYTMPSSVSDIYPYAFYGCKSIESIELSGGLKTIPPYAFSLCTGISKITIPYSVNSIDIKAFENCVNLSEVNIKESVNYIHDTAFDGCSKLNIIAPEGSYAKEWFSHFDTSEVVIIEKEDNTPSDKPVDNEYVEHKVPVGVVPIPGQFGETIVVGRQAVFMINNTNQTVSSGVISPSDTDSYSGLVLGDTSFDSIQVIETNGKGLSLPKFAIIGDEIASKAFYQDDTLKVYEIADDITSIADFAFARSGLTEITIPDSVTHIGYGAFYHCDDLTKILVPTSVTDIEPSAFSKTRMLDNWYAYGNSDYLIMGDGILVAYRGTMSSVLIPDGVKQIGPECFKNHVEINEVTIPETVVRICEDSFSGCARLKTIVGASNVEVIEDRAFSGCPIETVRIPESVKKIGLGAFDLTNVNISEDKKVAYFYSDTIPELSFNKTSTRLTNDSFRKDALSGIHVCIINDENVLRNNTLLDRNVSGFSGVICIITSENNEYSNGRLKIVDCTLTSDEAVSVNIPETVYVFGKGYNFDFDELSSVIEMAKNGDYVKTEKSSNSISVAGTDKKYVLSLIKTSSFDNEIKDAYKRIYGDTIPVNFTSYDIGVREEDNEIPLSKFGKLSMEMNIKLPDNIPTANLHVICLDENNQLEDLPFEVKSNNDELYVCFNISHTGPYGLYSFNSTAVSYFNLDQTPDTGDGIHPKWFLSLGLLALGVALILYKKESAVV